MAAATPRPRRPGAFHRLRVAAVEPVAADAVAVTFAVPWRLRAAFRFQAGQHLTLRTTLDGAELRRSYSLCTPAPDGPLRVAVRRLPGGAVSSLVHDRLRPGDAVEVMEPAGGFTVAFDPSARRRYCAIAAGSGITPVLSLVATALATEPASEVVLLYGNRTAASTMFVDEIADLKDRHLDRLQVLHVLSRERQELELATGRLDGPKLRAIFSGLVAPRAVDLFWLCGPDAMVHEAQAVLAAAGVAPAAVRTELFFVEERPPQRSAAEATALARGGTVRVTARLGGRETTFTMARAGTLVDGFLAVRPDVPFSCKGGVCATCRARLLEGEVAMDHSYALEPGERARGWVLTCQAHPLTDEVVVDYDG